MKPKLHFPNFTINILNINKKSKRINNRKVTRKCYAIILIENGKIKAKVSLLNNECNSDFIICSLTAKSYDLRGRTHVFTKSLHEHNRPILVIRSYDTAMIFPGTSEQYTNFKHNSLVVGRLIKTNDTILFDYDTLVALTPDGVHINPVNVDTSKPLFNND